MKAKEPHQAINFLPSSFKPNKPGWYKRKCSPFLYNDKLNYSVMNWFDGSQWTSRITQALYGDRNE